MMIKNTIRNILIVALILLLQVTTVVTPVMAVDTYKYYATIHVTDTTGTNRVNVPVILDTKGTTLISSGYLAADGLDMRITEGSTVLPFMSNTNNIAFVIPSLTAYQSKACTIYTGYNPDITNFYIVPGTGGYVTIADDEDLELGNNFEITEIVYVDTTAGAGKNLLFKDGAIKTYVNSGNVKVEVTGGDSIETAVITNGYHTITYSGSITSPPAYTEIHDVDELQAIENDVTGNYILANDIDATETAAWNGGVGFIPIGISNHFTGILDGNNYNITNLYIDTAVTTPVGLFSISDTGVIQNVNLVDVDITVNRASPNSSQGQVGSLIGQQNGGYVENCSASGVINTNNRSSTGGLIGYSNYSVIKSNSLVDITITCPLYYDIDGRIGGLIGQVYNSGFVEDSFSNCNIMVTITDRYVSGGIGGLVGELIYTNGNGYIDNCYSVSSITINEFAAGSGSNAVGGILGSNGGGTVTHSYSATSISRDLYLSDGFCGYNGGTINTSYFDSTVCSKSSTSATSKTTAQMKTQSTYTGWDFASTWVIDGGVNSGYPSFIEVVTNLLSIQIDSSPVVTTSFNTPIPDTANDYIINQGNATDAILYFSLSINGTEKLRYYPANIISNTTIEDVVNNYDGVMTWGTNNGLTITIDAFNSYIASTPTSGTGTTTLLGADEPDHWFGHNEALTAMPFFEQVHDAADGMGMEVIAMYLWLGLAIATAIGLGVLLFTGSTMVATIAMLTYMYSLYNQNILPGLFFALAILASICIIYVSRQT